MRLAGLLIGRFTTMRISQPTQRAFAGRVNHHFNCLQLIISQIAGRFLRHVYQFVRTTLRLLFALVLRLDNGPILEANEEELSGRVKRNHLLIAINLLLDDD
jgi:hypothetical protein